MHDDLYALLGVEQSATIQEIRRAYRGLARRYHPDLHPDDPAATEHLKRLNTAVVILSDLVQRYAYDLAIAMAQHSIGVDIMPPSMDNGYDVIYPISMSRAAAEVGTTCWLEFHDTGGVPYRVSIAVPPNSQPGDRLRKPGAGGPNLDGTRRGDLIVVVQFGEPHGIPWDGAAVGVAKAAGAFRLAIILTLFLLVIAIVVCSIFGYI